MFQVNTQAAPDRPLQNVELLPQPLHPILQLVSAGDHLLQIPQVPIQSAVLNESLQARILYSCSTCKLSGTAGTGQPHAWPGSRQR